MSITSKNSLARQHASSLLTRDDVAKFLVAFYGAVALDQVRVDQLREEGFLSCNYDRKEWKEYRRDRLEQLELLLDSLSRISQDTLGKLTILATTGKPTVVREALLELLTNGTCAHFVQMPMYGAPEFFSRLVEYADKGARAPKNVEKPAERMMRWFDPVDPLRIAREEDYEKNMPPKIWR